MESPSKILTLVSYKDLTITKDHFFVVSISLKKMCTYVYTKRQEVLDPLVARVIGTCDRNQTWGLLEEQQALDTARSSLQPTLHCFNEHTK